MKNNLRTIFSLFFIILTNYSYSLAEESSKKAGVITLYKGEMKVIAVNTPTRVVISNPNVADVTSISADEMFISAKDTGTTNLAWWDSRGEHTSRLEVFLENMRPVKERIDNILKEMNLASVFARSLDSEAKVLLLGYVKTSQDLERINVALSALKDKTINLIRVKEEEAVVGIDVQVLELDRDATTTLGFSWPGSLSLTESSGPTTTAATGLKDIFHVSDFTRSALNLTLDALVQEGKARILSQPRLSCQSGKEAELLVGGEKPIMTTQVSGWAVSSTSVSSVGGTQVEYKEYGIKLKIKPTVTDEKKIKLALNVEVSEVGTAETLGSSSSPTAKAYPLTKRNASTELFLNDGQTMAIGGLKKQKSEEDIRKTPFLGDVPILGLLFRKRTTRVGGGQGERGDVELFITLTPTIIKEEIKREETKPEIAPPKKEEAEPKVAPVAEEKKKLKKVSPTPKKEIKKEKKVKVKVEPAIKEKKPKPIKEKKKVKIKKEEPKPKGEAKVKIETAEYLYELGMDFYRAGRYDEALIEFNKVLMLDPSHETAKKYKKLIENTSSTKAVSDYMRVVSQRIQDNFIYPWSATQAKLEGSLRLSIHLDYTGKLLDAEIRESSGFAVFDENALNTVKKVAPYPAFPAEMKQKELWIDLPVIYKTK